jgi:predicted nucleic acid-binding Zn ribbon protein
MTAPKEPAEKQHCPYCSWPIRHGAKACSAHMDLLRLDLQQTGWKPK